MTVGLTLLPSSIEDVRRIREMRALRGAGTGVRNLPALVVPAVIGGLERSMRLAEAMEARGYGTAPPQSRATRLSGAMAAPLLLGAASVWYYYISARPLAGVLAALGAASLVAWVWSAAHSRHTTSLHSEPLPPIDALLAIASLAVALFAIAAASAGWVSVKYNPFAALAWPTFSIRRRAAGARLRLAGDPAGVRGHRPGGRGGRRAGRDPRGALLVIATLRDVTYRYPGASVPALDRVSLEVAAGSFTLLAGPSAGGKSTLLRLFNGLVPQFHGGRIGGTVEVAGLDPTRTPTRRMATVAGLVFQEPEAQAVAETVEDEIAFGMEQHGVPAPEMQRRIDALLPALGIEALRRRRLATLSGGERQRVAIAAVLALEPRLLLLDEPTSQLDPAGAEAVLAALQRLHGERELTVLIPEHRLERLLPVVGGVVQVEGGRAVAMSPREAAGRLAAVPPVCELGRTHGWTPLPLTVGEAAAVRRHPARAACEGGSPRRATNCSRWTG